MVDLIEINRDDLLPREDLQAFLESPADADRIVTILSRPGMQGRIGSLIPSRRASFRALQDAIEVELTELCPGGRPASLAEFEERLLLLGSRGYLEKRRGEETDGSDQECQDCLEILSIDATECGSCGSQKLARSRIPESITLMWVEQVENRSNEEVLEGIWRCLEYLSVDVCE